MPYRTPAPGEPLARRSRTRRWHLGFLALSQVFFFLPVQHSWANLAWVSAGAFLSLALFVLIEFAS